jgi:hypothetical protein
LLRKSDIAIEPDALVHRTNVVQSAISRWVLNRHLVHLGITSQEEAGMHDQLDMAFNSIWADNGDAISREVGRFSCRRGRSRDI